MENKYRAFKFKFAYDLVTCVYVEVCIGLTDKFASFFYRKDEYFLNKVLKASRETLLHDYIEMIWRDSNQFCRNNLEYDLLLGRYYEILSTYEIPIPEADASPSKEKYLTLLEERIAPATVRIVDEAFTILYPNRMFLLQFNKLIQ